MSRLHKILLGVFCGGVLLAGIGTGIAFGEFSALTYGGEKMLGEVRMAERELDVEIEPGEEPWTLYGYNMYFDLVHAGTDRDGITLDESIPENTVRFRVTYNEARVEPMAESWEEGREINLYCAWQGSDELELMLEAKDQVLADLKEGKISSYDAVEVESVEVLVNPVNEGDVRIIW